MDLGGADQTPAGVALAHDGGATRRLRVALCAGGRSRPVAARYAPIPMGLASLLFLGLVIAWLAGVLAIHRALTRPARRTYATAVARNRAGDPSELDPPRRFESWTFTSRGLTLSVWDITGDDPAGPIVVLSHGWGDSRIGALQRLPLVAGVASRVIAWDMPAHGEAPGGGSLGTHEVDDLLGLLDAIGEPHRPTLLYGWSLGAGVSIGAAARVRDAAHPTIVGVVAEAPYRVPRTPALRMLRAMRIPHAGMLGPALLLASRTAPLLRRPGEFDRAALAARVRCPLLVLHGSHDEICPVDDGRAIGAAATHHDSSTQVFEGALHNDLWQDQARVARAADAIARMLTSGTSGPSSAATPPASEPRS